MATSLLDSHGGNRGFEDAFESLGRELGEELEGRTGEFPDQRSDAGDLFEGQVAETPREVIADGIYLRWRGAQPDRIRDRIADERLADGLLRAYQLDHLLRTVDRLQSRVADGEFDRPDGIEPVRETKDAAVGAVEDTLDDPAHPHLVTHQIGAAVGRIRRADESIDEGRYTPDTATIRATGEYALAAELARAVPASTGWFVERLP